MVRVAISTFFQIHDGEPTRARIVISTVASVLRTCALIRAINSIESDERTGKDFRLHAFAISRRI
jgi:hypothetical protein